MAPDGDEDDYAVGCDLHLGIEQPQVVGKQVPDLLQEVSSSYPGSYAGVGVKIVGPHLLG